MRLWHKDLIHVLPQKQLLGQWRECCTIAKAIAEKGTPNRMLVNKIMDYPLKHFWRYSMHVFMEAKRRGYNVDWNSISGYFNFGKELVYLSDVFDKWHTDRYLLQCYYNLEEKYDCGAISEEEFAKVRDFCADKI